MRKVCVFLTVINQLMMSNAGLAEIGDGERARVIGDVSGGKFRPSFKWEEELLACEIQPLSSQDFISVGEINHVVIDIPYAESVGVELVENSTFQLCSASILVGRGTVFQVL